MESKAGQNESKIDSFRTLHLARLREMARPIVKTLVRRRRIDTDSKMRAYDDVADWLGAKATWVRRCVSGAEVGMSGDRLLRIAAAYRIHCDGIALGTAEERAEIARRWEEFNALFEGLGRPDTGVRGVDPQSGGADRHQAGRALARQGGRP